MFRLTRSEDVRRRRSISVDSVSPRSIDAVVSAASLPRLFPDTARTRTGKRARARLSPLRLARLLLGRTSIQGKLRRTFLRTVWSRQQQALLRFVWRREPGMKIKAICIATIAFLTVTAAFVRMRQELWSLLQGLLP